MSTPSPNLRYEDEKHGRINAKQTEMHGWFAIEQTHHTKSKSY